MYVSQYHSALTDRGKGKSVPVQAIKPHGRKEVRLHPFLPSVLEEGTWLSTRPSHFTAVTAHSTTTSGGGGRGIAPLILSPGRFIRGTH
jgi:hypothetical protein